VSGEIDLSIARAAHTLTLAHSSESLWRSRHLDTHLVSTRQPWRVISQDYLLPIRQDALLSKENINIIFSNIESISSFHHEQLSAFERDPDHMGPSFQKLVCRSITIHH